MDGSEAIPPPNCGFLCKRNRARRGDDIYTRVLSAPGEPATTVPSLLGDVGDSSYPEFIAEVGALVMGSATYEWMLRNADKVAAETGSPWPYTQPTWILSNRTLPAIAGADIRFFKGDVRHLHAQMRSAAGSMNIWVVGGGDVAGQFHDAGLLDELLVQIGSVTLGQGKPLLPRRILSPNLRLVSVRRIGSGMAELRYEVCRSGGD